METLAYLQNIQEQDSSENKELTLDLSRIKLAGTLLGATGAALAVGSLTSAPAQAYGGGYGGGCYDYGCGYDSGRYVSGGYSVTSFKTYEVSYPIYDSYYPTGCYDDYCGVSYGGGYGGGCYDDCYGIYGGGYGGYGGGYGGYGGGYDIGYGGGYGGCYDDCYGGYGGGYDVGYGGGYGGGCYDYCGVSYGYSTYDIQVALTYAGFHVAVDGVYGHQTDSAVRAFQVAVGLIPDGIVGPATASALGLY